MATVEEYRVHARVETALFTRTAGPRSRGQVWGWHHREMGEHARMVMIDNRLFPSSCLALVDKVVLMRLQCIIPKLETTIGGGPEEWATGRPAHCIKVGVDEKLASLNGGSFGRGR